MEGAAVVPESFLRAWATLEEVRDKGGRRDDGAHSLGTTVGFFHVLDPSSITKKNFLWWGLWDHFRCVSPWLNLKTRKK